VPPKAPKNPPMRAAINPTTTNASVETTRSPKPAHSTLDLSSSICFSIGDFFQGTGKRNGTSCARLHGNWEISGKYPGPLRKSTDPGRTVSSRLITSQGPLLGGYLRRLSSVGKTIIPSVGSWLQE
jgi:hypothetical protein